MKKRRACLMPLAIAFAALFPVTLANSKTADANEIAPPAMTAGQAAIRNNPFNFVLQRNQEPQIFVARRLHSSRRSQSSHRSRYSSRR